MATRKHNSKLKENSFKYYSTGSTAPLVNPLEYPNYEPEIFPGRRHKPKQNPNKRKQKQENKQYVRQTALYHLKFLCTCVLVLIGCLSMIAFDSTITEQNKQIESLTYELSQLVEENSTLETAISEQIDLKYIEKIATEKLSMSKPAKHQIVYIDVPTSNYTVQNDERVKTENDSGILGSVKSFISDIFKK